MIKLREANQEDFDFLYKLKKATLIDVISQTWGWDEDCQKNYFSQNFKPDNLRIITESGRDIGCFATLEEKHKFDLSLIEILPEYQNRGIGSALIKNLILRAKEKKKSISLQVLKVNNKAVKLYKRLNFSIEDENETHYHMLFKI